MSGSSERAKRQELARQGQYKHPGRQRRLGVHDLLPSKKYVIEGSIATVGGALEILGGHIRDIGILNWIGYGTLAIGVVTLLVQGGLYLNYHKHMRS